MKNRKEEWKKKKKKTKKKAKKKQQKTAKIHQKVKGLREQSTASMCVICCMTGYHTN